MDKGKIIIVEDEQSILTMLSEFLSANGYTVEPYIDSKKALSALKNNGYQVLVSGSVQGCLFQRVQISG